MKHLSRISWIRLLAAAIAILSLMNCAFAEEATVSAAAPTLEISTKYPALTVKAGDSLTFDLDIDNRTGASQDVALTVSDSLEGWIGTFSASGKEVSVVHVKDENANTDVDFNLDIPLDAQDGDYTLTLQANGKGISGEMNLTLKVNAEESGSSNFTVEYPSQEGSADTSFSFDATLINNTLSKQSYAFSTDAPSGWTVSVSPSGETTKVSALDVEPRSSQGLDINITAPDNIEAGEYKAHCTATTATEKLEVELNVTITGSYGIELSTPSSRLSLDAYANQQSAVQITVSNMGNTDLTNVNLTSSSMPSGWTISFEKETIDIIESGETVETTTYIKPGEDTMSGDYAVSLRAKNTDANDTAEFRVTVKTETKWGVTGVIIIVALLAALFVVMKKYGRR